MYAFILLAVTQLPIWDADETPRFDMGADEELSFSMGGDSIKVFAPKPLQSHHLKRSLVYSPSWCSGCQQFERTTVGNDEFAFDFIHDENRFPPFVQDAISKGQVWPAVHFEAQPGKWRIRYGPTSYSEFKQHYEDCLKSPALNVKIAPKGHASYRLTYGMYRSVYYWPGDLRQHLKGSPHNLDSSYVNSLSDEQAISVHDNWHIQQDSGRRVSVNYSQPQRRGLFGLFRSRS